MKIAISGASGLIGTALDKQLYSQRDTVARLVRPGHPKQANDIAWDPATGQVDISALEGVDVPIAFGLRSGHVSRQNVTLTFGVQAELEAGDDAELRLVEPAVTRNDNR